VNKEVASQPKEALAGSPSVSRLRELWQHSLSSWPEVAELSFELFADAAARQFGDSTSLSESEFFERASEVYLVSACIAEKSGAFEAFSRSYLQPLRHRLQRLGLDPQQLDDVEQTLRTRLFVADAESSPRILKYAGKGRLGGLVQVVATRIALDLLRKNRNEAVADELTLLEVPAAIANPDLIAIRRECRADFRQAFSEALAALSSRDRTVLRLRYLEDLQAEDIGKIFSVHRVTVSRWFSSIRNQLGQDIRRRLRARLSLTESQLSSLFRELDSELELSLERLLASSQDALA
jgi:RNA polymerase sigma-70 factor (ECF subfamily)